MARKHIKVVCYFSIFAFLLFRFLEFSVSDSLGWAVALGTGFDVIYDQFLWKFNLWEPTPRISGVYDAMFVSNYNNLTLHPSKIVVKQTLSEISISEEAHDGRSVAVTAKLVPGQLKNDPWELYFTYKTTPNSSDHNDPHHGTAILRIKNSSKLEGPYYTNRLQQTKGTLIMVRRQNPNVKVHIDVSNHIAN